MGRKGNSMEPINVSRWEVKKLLKNGKNGMGNKRIREEWKRRQNMGRKGMEIEWRNAS